MAHLRIFNSAIAKRAGSAIAILSALTLNLVSLPSTAEVLTPKSYIVVLKDNADPDAVGKEHSRTFVFPPATHTYKRVIKGYAARIPPERLVAIKLDPRVLYVSEDLPVQASQQTLPTGVQRMGAKVSSTRSGDGKASVNTPVAILDSGIDLSHPDLNVVGGTDCVGNSKSYNDGNGHGTHVAGIVAAKDNAMGVVGVAPGAPLYAVRVLDDKASANWSNVICGIEWVTANAASTGIKVANMSLSGIGSADDGNCGYTNKDALHQAICSSVAQGITYVVSAGNGNQDFATVTPAAYKEVLTVTAMADSDGNAGGSGSTTCLNDADDTAAYFSNFTTIGSNDVNHTIAAPGECIYSTWMGGSYNTYSGTSMAVPHVTGTVAMCIASGKCAGMTPQQIISKLRSDAATQPVNYGFRGDPNSPNGNRYYGPMVYTGKY